MQHRPEETVPPSPLAEGGAAEGHVGTASIQSTNSLSLGASGSRY